VFENVARHGLMICKPNARKPQALSAATTMSGFDFVFNPNHGLGDCLSCFNTNRPIWSPSPHYALLRRLSSIPSLDSPVGAGRNILQLQRLDLGREHLYNRVRICCGEMPPLAQPRALLDRISYEPDVRKIAFSFDVGSNVANQKGLHARPRMLYPEHRSTIQRFISQNVGRYHFIEVGRTSFNFNDTQVSTGIGLEATIEVLRHCHGYFGIHSGMMHLATAIGLTCTIIVNFPPAEFLPGGSAGNCLSSNAMWNVELQWLYPQHRYLHEDATEGRQAITLETLQDILPCGHIARFVARRLRGLVRRRSTYCG
jgi:hypothetical protein